MNRKELQSWGALGLCSLAMGTELTPGNTPLSHMRYAAELDHSRSNGASIMNEIHLKN